MNQFLVHAALKEAQAVIERNEVLRLSSGEWRWLMDLLDSPPEPNAKLKSALARYNEAKQDDAGSTFSG